MTSHNVISHSYEPCTILCKAYDITGHHMNPLWILVCNAYEPHARLVQASYNIVHHMKFPWIAHICSFFPIFVPKSILKMIGIIIMVLKWYYFYVALDILVCETEVFKTQLVVVNKLVIYCSMTHWQGVRVTCKVVNMHATNSNATEYCFNRGMQVAQTETKRERKREQT